MKIRDYEKNYFKSYAGYFSFVYVLYRRACKRKQLGK
jgi:hypothetical protein